MDYPDVLLCVFVLILLLTLRREWRARRRRRVLRDWAPLPTLTDLRRVNELRLARRRVYEAEGAE